jgi:hypothetical protein
MVEQPGIFGIDERYGASSAAGDPLKWPGVCDFKLSQLQLPAALSSVMRLRNIKANAV